MRFISAPFETLLTDDLWQSNGAQANAMARRLAERLTNKCSLIKIMHLIESNAVFAIAPSEIVKCLLQHTFFGQWDEKLSEGVG